MNDDDKKTVLLYGDSFYWGIYATTGKRHQRQDRVDVVCQQELGDDFEVINEGLRGRTMFGENGAFPERDGLTQFGPIFASQLPIDIVVIMLGTNDINTATNHDVKEIAASLDSYKEKMKYWCEFMKFDVPKVVVLAPPHINESELVVFRDLFGGADQYIDPLAAELETKAVSLGWSFLDLRPVVSSSGMDGLHLDPQQSVILGQKIAETIKTL
ncbi:MAG: GDSL-type esterase/lipase family protein [Candidatus Saccharibacteria bacterium]|nr:GDSL-type esterase/lipase family protein [Candidatus Saccharibacteria bacterium]